MSPIPQQQKLRPDWQVIADLIEPNSRVLEVGCSDGALLAWLQANKNIHGRGMELDQANVSECLAKGLSVIQGNADSDLAYYPDQSVDYVILSRTLQALNAPKDTLKQLVRIGKRVVLSVPNFGHWPNRLQLMFKGRMPVTREISYEWYDTPNIHFCTIRDFITLCEAEGYQIETRLYTSSFEKVRAFHGRSHVANILGKQGVFVIQKLD